MPRDRRFRGGSNSDGRYLLPGPERLSEGDSMLTDRGCMESKLARQARATGQGVCNPASSGVRKSHRQAKRHAGQPHERNFLPLRGFGRSLEGMGQTWTFGLVGGASCWAMGVLIGSNFGRPKEIPKLEGVLRHPRAFTGLGPESCTPFFPACSTRMLVCCLQKPAA
jgi:hypothetical protein